MTLVFGFSFAPWHQANLWDERYECYSFIEKGLMLANVGLYRCDLIIDDRPLTAFQIGAVATRPEYRNQGLAGTLLNFVLERYSQAPLFLFANENMLDFYPRFGFHRIYESRPTLERQTSNKPARAMKVRPDDPLVEHYLNNGRLCSRRFYCKNGRSLEHFHLLLSYPDSIYHLPEQDALVVAQVIDDSLFVPYLNAPEAADYERLFQDLPFSGPNLRFGFMPDQKLVRLRWSIDLGDEEPMFVRGKFPLPEPFTFPAMAKT